MGIIKIWSDFYPNSLFSHRVLSAFKPLDDLITKEMGEKLHKQFIESITNNKVCIKK